MNVTPTLRIAHIDTGMTLRGGQRQMLMLAEGLRARSHDQMLVCNEGSTLEERAQGGGFRVFSLPAHDPCNAFGIMLWRQQLQSWAPHVLHAHDGRGQTIAWLASLGLPVRRVASRRVTFLPSARWTYRFKYGHTCDAVIAISENIRELSLQAGVAPERITVIPDGIEIPPALPGTEERLVLRTSWGCDGDDFVVGMLGASTPEKGRDVALAAMALLAEKLPSALLVLAGEDDAAADDRPSSARRSRHVTCLGPLRTLADFFPGLDLLIMPSKSEGLGSSALWAMAYGLPVLATRVGGLAEIVVENETGWLVPPGSAEALAGAILRAAGERDRLAAFGRNARRRAQDFSADIMIRRTEALYQRLMR